MMRRRAILTGAAGAIASVCADRAVALGAARAAGAGGDAASRTLPAQRRALATVHAPPAEAETIVRIGTVPGPQAEILEHVRALAAPEGLRLQLDVRPGGRAINADVAHGGLDAAAFQDGVAFVDESLRTGRPLVVVATTVTLPMALYSRRLRHPTQVRDGDAIALPREPAARARALVLLQNYGLVGLRDDIGLHARLDDVVVNPRRLHLEAMPSTRLFDALPRVALAAIDDEAATRAGLEPGRDSIGLEDARSPWAGVLAVRRERVHEPWVAQLVAACRRPEIKRFLLERWGDSVRRPW